MYTMKAFGKNFRGETFAEMSAQYEAARTVHFRAGGRPAAAKAMLGREYVARVSNNGRVWPPKAWEVGQVPLYDNRNA